MLWFVSTLVLLVPELPPECQAPPLREVTALTGFAQRSGALSVGLDSVATWCFDPGGSWTGGHRPVKGKLPAKLEPTGDCAKSVASCQAARLNVTVEDRDLLLGALGDLERPFLGLKYKPKRSGLGERPSEVVDCGSRERSTLFSQAQARMDLARLASQAQNEYANYKTWLFGVGLKCAQLVAQGEKDVTRRIVDVDVPTEGGGELQVPGLAKAGGQSAASAGAQGGPAGTSAGASGASSGSGAPAGAGAQAGISGTRTGSNAQGLAGGALADAGAQAAVGGATAGAGAQPGLTGGRAGAGAQAGVAGATADAGVHASVGGATAGAEAHPGVTGGRTGAGALAGGTTGTGGTASGAGAQPGVGGTPARAASGGPHAGVGEAATQPGATGGQARVEGTTPSGAGAPAAGVLPVGGPTAERERALASSLLDKWRFFAAERTRFEADPDWRDGFLRSRELRECRCVRFSPADLVRRIEQKDRLPELEADDEKLTRCEVCLEDAYPPWKKRAQTQCALLLELTEFEVGALERSDDGNGLPPRCVEAARQRRAGVSITATAPKGGTTVAAGQGGAFIIAKTPPLQQPEAGDFVKPSDYAPIPQREEGRIYVRVFTSAACVAEILPGPLQARTGDVLPLPANATEFTVRGPCGGLAEVYFGREERPRVSDTFAKTKPLRVKFTP